MLTSFAPSPIAKVVTLGLFAIMSLTISAFCLGDIRQAIRTELEQANFKNYLVILCELMILKRDSPDTTVPEVLNPSELICIFRESAI
jgi:hypothetical protein